MSAGVGVGVSAGAGVGISESGSGKERRNGSAKERASGSGSQRSGPKLTLQKSTAAIVRACLSAAGEDEEEEEEGEEGEDPSPIPHGREGRRVLAAAAAEGGGGGRAGKFRGGRSLLRAQSADAVELRRGGDALLQTRLRTRFDPRPPLRSAAAPSPSPAARHKLHATISDASSYALAMAPGSSLGSLGWMLVDREEEQQNGRALRAHNSGGNHTSVPHSSDGGSNGSSSSSDSSRIDSNASSSTSSGSGTPGEMGKGGGGQAGLAESSPHQQNGQLFSSPSQQEKVWK